MYQPPRPSTRATASAANSPRTNPLRSNNDRDDAERRRSYDVAPSMSRAISDSGSDMTTSQGSDPRQTDQAKEVAKLNQIVQVLIRHQLG
jgi:hypothetical protein